MTTIRANCPSCGDVQLTADDLTVRVCADDERGSYCFQCPECMRAVAKDATRRIVDLLDFHLLLQTDTWFAQLTDDVRGLAEPPGALGSPA